MKLYTHMASALTYPSLQNDEPNLDKLMVTDTTVLPYLGPTMDFPSPNFQRSSYMATPAPGISPSKKSHLDALTISLSNTLVSEWTSEQVQAFFYFNGSSNVHPIFGYLTGKLLLSVTEKDLKTNGIKNERQIKSLMLSIQILKETKYWDVSDQRMWSNFRCVKWLHQWGVEIGVAEAFCEHYYVFGGLLKDFSAKALINKLNLKGIQHIKARLIIDMMNFPSFFDKGGSWTRMTHRDVSALLNEIGYPSNVIEAFSNNRIEGCLLKWVNILEFGFSHYISRSLEFAIRSILKDEPFLNVSQMVTNYDKVNLGEEGRRIIQEKCIHGAYFNGMDEKEFVSTFNLSDRLRLGRLMQIRSEMIECPLKRLNTEKGWMSFYTKKHLQNHCWVCCDKYVSHQYELCGCVVVCGECALTHETCPKCNTLK
jgi:hypothetical protein